MWRTRDGVRHLQSALSIYLERARPPRVQLQCAHNICTPLYSSLPRPIPPPTVGGGHTVQLGHTIYISCSWTLASLSYLHNRHKGVRVRWLEVVSLSAPLRLVVPMIRKPELDNSKVHRKWCTHDATACQLEVLTSHISETACQHRYSILRRSLAAFLRRHF